MKKVKAILHTLKASLIPNHIFYPKLLHTRTLFSFKYFLTCITFFAVILSAAVYTRIHPQKIAFYQNSFLTALKSFPEDAEFTLKHAKLSSTYRQPVFVWMNIPNGKKLLLFAANQHSLLKQNDFPNALVFFAAEQMRLSLRGSSIILPYPSTDYIVNKYTIDSFLEIANVYSSQAVVFFYLIYFVFFPLLYVLLSFEVSLIVSIVLFLLFRLFSKRIHLRKCFQVGFHASILPIIIGSLLLYTFPSVHGTITVTSGLVFVFQLIAIYETYFSELAKKLSSSHHTSGR